MLNKNLTLLFTSLTLLPTLTFAQGEREHGVGNGGDVVRCTGPNGVYYKMLDEIEGQYFYDIAMTALPGQDVREKVNTVIETIKSKYSVAIAEELKSYTEDFVTDVENYTGKPGVGITTRWVDGPVTHKNDSKFTFIPKHCEPNPIGLIDQQAPQYPESRRYTVSIPNFEPLDSDSRARAILHEAWYRRQLSQSTPDHDSRNARYLNATSSSSKFPSMSICDWAKRLNFSNSDSMLQFTDALGASHQIPNTTQMNCYSSGRLQSYTTVRNTHFSVIFEHQGTPIPSVQDTSNRHPIILYPNYTLKLQLIFSDAFSPRPIQFSLKTILGPNLRQNLNRSFLIVRFNFRKRVHTPHATWNSLYPIEPFGINGTELSTTGSIPLKVVGHKDFMMNGDNDPYRIRYEFTSQASFTLMLVPASKHALDGYDPHFTITIKAP